MLALYENPIWDSLHGAVVKNPPANAGDMGLSPGLGRSHIPIPHTAEQLSPCATTTALLAREPQLLKPMHLESVLHNKRSHCNEKSVHCNEE